jgi:hypothetical protein
MEPPDLGLVDHSTSLAQHGHQKCHSFASSGFRDANHGRKRTQTPRTQTPTARSEAKRSNIKTHVYSAQHAPRAMPPRKRRRRADGDPDASDSDEAGPGPSSRVAGLLDALDAVLAHGRLERGSIRATRRLCGRARLAVDGAIRTIDLRAGERDGAAPFHCQTQRAD